MLTSTSHSAANWVCMEVKRWLITGLKDQVFISCFRYPWYFIISLVLCSREESQAWESMHPEVTCLAYLAGGGTLIAFVLVSHSAVCSKSGTVTFCLWLQLCISGDSLRSTLLWCFTFRVFWSLACFLKVRRSCYMLVWGARRGRRENILL